MKLQNETERQKQFGLTKTVWKHKNGLKRQNNKKITKSFYIPKQRKTYS